MFCVQVYCYHESSGCLWRGRLCDVDSHLSSTCPHVPLACPNSCGETVAREAVQSHLTNSCIRRTSYCKHCQIEGPLDFITEKHLEVCPKMLLPCPNHCTVGKILREDIQGHMQECQLQEVECGFSGFGCDAVVLRKDLDAHMSSAQTQHLLLAMERVSELGHEIEAWRGDTEQLREELQRSRCETESLRNLVESLQTHQHLTTGVGSISGQPPRQQTRRLLMEKHLEASAQLCQQDPYLPVILKMDDFSFYSTNREPWYSHPFYSQPLGYKLCLCVYASGICSGQFTHISAYIHLMSGEFDNSQEWPLRLRLVIELQNQLADKDHWTVECEFSGSGPQRHNSQRVARGRARRGAGTATLIRLDKLGHNTAFSNCQYLRNNHLFFSVY